MMVTETKEQRAIKELDDLARALSLLLVAVIESLIDKGLLTRADIGEALLSSTEDLKDFMRAIAEDN